MNQNLLNLRKDKIVEIYPKTRNIREFFGQGKHQKMSPMSIEEIDDAIAQAVSTME
ncbi:MAG: hypothetical protein JSS34_00670 [Proteobacteria bacterium]|nr:hypothetical protein [Pseudomonadota bacterium]